DSPYSLSEAPAAFSTRTTVRHSTPSLGITLPPLRVVMSDQTGRTRVTLDVATDGVPGQQKGPAALGLGPSLRRSATPTGVPMRAPTPHTQPWRLVEAIPLKYAPMLQPNAMRAPYLRRKPPSWATAATEGWIRHLGAKPPASPAAKKAPSSRPRSIT